MQNFYEMGRRAIEAGRRGGPFAFLIPPEQHDAAGGREARGTADPGRRRSAACARTVPRRWRAVSGGHRHHPDGAAVSRLRQDAARTAAVSGPAPSRRAALPERPYDVAGWTLPYQMGVNVLTVERSFEPPPMSRLQSGGRARGQRVGRTARRLLLDRRPRQRRRDRRQPAGRCRRRAGVDDGTDRRSAASATNPARSSCQASKGHETVVAGIASELGLRADGMRGKPPPNTRPSAAHASALYKPWVENIDEGWTRWVLERHQFQFATLADAEVRAGGLRAQFDAIILPSASAERLTMGHAADAVPAEYVGGLGQAGVDALKAFVQEGGTLVCLDQSCELAISALSLDIRDVAREAGEKFFCPGSIVRIELDHRAPAGLRHAARDRRILCVQFRVPPVRRAPRRSRTYGPQRTSAQRLDRRRTGDRRPVGSRRGQGRHRTRRPPRLPRPAPRSIACDVPAAVQRAADSIVGSDRQNSLAIAWHRAPWHAALWHPAP